MDIRRHSRPTPRGLLPAALLLAGLLLLAGVGAAGAGPAAPRNVLLVSIDTLRADAVTAYGGPEGLTPVIDGLAERGVLFEDAITTIGKTGPSFSSLFTALYPPTHGARRNGVPLRPDVPVLAEILRERGYQTAAFITNWTLRANLSGLDRGFDHYDQDFNSRRYGIGPRERDAADATEAALAWLRSERPEKADEKSPLFLWVHFSEPHTPYVLHEDFTVGPEPASGDRWENKRHRYLSEVGYVDRWIGYLLHEVTPWMPPEETVIVFLSDHGESIGEHDYWGHGKNTHWPNLEVPLILAGPGLPAKTRVPGPVSLVDVVPTLAELLDFDLPELSEGRNLVGSWRTPISPHRFRYAFGDRHTALTEAAKSDYDHPLELCQQSQLVKTIYDFDRKSVRHYDLLEDQLELDPLNRAPVDTEPPLHRQLVSWYRQLAKYLDDRDTSLSEDDVEQLKSLGYVGE